MSVARAAKTQSEYDIEAILEYEKSHDGAV